MDLKPHLCVLLCIFVLGFFGTMALIDAYTIMAHNNYQITDKVNTTYVTEPFTFNLSNVNTSIGQLMTTYYDKSCYLNKSLESCNIIYDKMYVQKAYNETTIGYCNNGFYSKCKLDNDTFALTYNISVYYTITLTYTYQNYTYDNTFNTSALDYIKPTSLHLYIHNDDMSATYTNTSTLTTTDAYDRYNIRYASLIMGFSIAFFIIFFCMITACVKECTRDSHYNDFPQCLMLILLILIVGFAIIPAFYHNNDDVINTSYVTAYNYTTIEPITTTVTTTSTILTTISPSEATILTQANNDSINSIDITMVTCISIIIILLICITIYIVKSIKSKTILLNNDENIKKMDNMIAKMKLVDFVVQNGVYGDINTELAKKYEKLKMTYTCTICGNEENAFVYPCGHMIGLKCHERMTNGICHICRTEYEIAIKIFA